MASKSYRQNIIKDLLNERHISSHDELAKMLSAEKIFVTQATLSRDFAEMGVIRTVSELGTRYVLNAQESGKQIAKLIGFEIISVHHNESMVIIRTLAGRAQGVAHYIDRLNKPEILGTVGGDDTVLVIPSSQKNVETVVSLIKSMMIEQPGNKKHNI